MVVKYWMMEWNGKDGYEERMKTTSEIYHFTLRSYVVTAHDGNVEIILHTKTATAS